VADPVAEGLRLVMAAEAEQLRLRMLGGVAVRSRCPRSVQGPLAREYRDLDFVVARGQARGLTNFLKRNGYGADERFNSMHGESRLLFRDLAGGRRLDVFLGTFAMCHSLNLEPRLSLHDSTLSPADLLLTKLQIVELNRKDVQDALALLLDFPAILGSKKPGEELDVGVLVELCGRDWGWYTTLNDNLDQLVARAPEFLSRDESVLVAQHARVIKDAIDSGPKSVGWRLRAKVGRKLQWYELPEEVDR